MRVVDLAAVRAERSRTAAAALEAARRALGRRAMSVAELERALDDREVDAADRDAAIAALVDEGALDDAALAASVVERMRARKQAGWRAITAELQRRRIPTELWGEAPDADDELERAIAAAEHRARSLPDDDAGRRRLAGWLARRGYPAGVCMRAVEAVTERAEN